MQLHTFIASAIYAGVLSTSLYGRFTSITKEGWNGLRVGVDTVANKESFHPVENRTPVA